MKKRQLHDYQSHLGLYQAYQQEYEITHHVDGCKKLWTYWKEADKENSKEEEEI